MPTLGFNGKQHIYAHHLTMPKRSLKARGADGNPIVHGDNPEAPMPRYDTGNEGRSCNDKVNSPHRSM